ncbi:MAG TPA: DNA topoisomerase IV subunit B [Steroidobacteraceae bacterium]|nr:DNA topoisomerase IV subunit B [Steroidobacteraceae bacterium]
MSQSYTASDIEVLTGLEPVRRRPGMYTDTRSPNHLVHEVVDNSVDEALAGHCRNISVVVHDDGSVSVDDDGRGMPVDIHPKEKISGVELIMTRLHAGGKFSDKNYAIAGGLHGVGVSIVNALSKHLECNVRRDGREWNIGFRNGKVVSKLEAVGPVKRGQTGTTVRFWPDAGFFDSANFSVSRLRHVLKAKAVLCPGLRVRLQDEATGESEEWFFSGNLAEYLIEQLGDAARLPDEPFTGSVKGGHEVADWAFCWVPDSDASVAESYVNLIPTPQGGTHVNGLRAGATDAVREFCEFRNLVPRGLKLTPEDVWQGVAFILSVRMQNPQFAGQMKEKLAARESAAFVSGVVKDAFALWLNQHPEAGEKIAQFAIGNAQERTRAAQRISRKRIVSGPALPGKLADCTLQDPERCELFLVEGDSAGGSAKQARDREFQAVMPLRGKILNTWEVEAADILSSQEVHDIATALGVDPGSGDLSGLRYHKICILADADSDGAHIATLLCALFLRHFRPLVLAGHAYVAMPPLFRIDLGKNVYYALGEYEKNGILDRIQADGLRGKPVITRFKGLGEMSALQLRETTMAPATRRLVQLTVDAKDGADQVMDMLLAKKRAADRREWLESKGNLASV